ncbi:MAG TPA: hypothetical protein VNB22_12870 [Pyrinomonadaceae bacterium]|nr:hypothetical protein [Pyrinomonadaceae bacterium]
MAFKCTGDDPPETIPSATDAQSRSRVEMPSLAGSKWTLRSITEKGVTEEVYSTQPTLDFYRNGKWFMNRYPSGFQSGTYKTGGSRLTMHIDDGTVMGSFTLEWDSAAKILEMDNGKNVWRLEYDGFSE